MSINPPPLLKVINLTKKFEGITVLDDVNFDLNAGEGHVLFGENGAGKTTFTKILCGGYLPNKGEIIISGQKANIKNPSDSKKLGIVAVHQDFSLIPQLSVIENLYLGREYKKNCFLDKKSMVKEASEYLESLNLDFEIGLKEKINELTIEKQQIVAIARAMLQSVKILILDEPTSSFTDRETKMLFDHIEELKKKGIGIIYISHVVEELKAVGDRVTILRDGKIVGSINKNSEITKDNLLEGMIGSKEEEPFPKLRPFTKRTNLRIQKLYTKSGLKDVDFELRAGEIIGIGGLPDSGKSRIGRAIFGLDKILSGDIQINNHSISNKLSPSKALQHDVIYFPPEKLEALVLCRNMLENQTLPSLKQKFMKKGVLQKPLEKRRVSEQIEKLSIKPPNMFQRVRYLSGGNQQKVVISRGLLKNANTFIFDDITRGVDIASKIEFYRIVNELAVQGKGILFISSEISELLNLCHNIIIMYNKKIFKYLNKDSATREKLIHCLLGLEMEV
jgi:ribose transport system ATP-binding protein